MSSPASGWESTACRLSAWRQVRAWRSFTRFWAARRWTRQTIAAAAAAGDATARETLQLFARLCGAVAGNLALTCLPFGGLYLTGGVVQNNQPLFSSPAFMDTFQAKGRMTRLLRRMPLHIIGEPRVGLLGAAAHAARHLAGE